MMHTPASDSSGSRASSFKPARSPIPPSESESTQRRSSSMENQPHRPQDDPFLRHYQPSELRIASEFFATWLPFLSGGLCSQCSRTLSDRIRSIVPESFGDAQNEILDENSSVSCANGNNLKSHSHEDSDNHDDNCDAHSLGSWGDGAKEKSYGEGSSLYESAQESCNSPLLETPSPRMSWADMSQESDDFGEEEQEHKNVTADSSPLAPTVAVNASKKPTLPREQREYIRFTNVRRKKDFICYERVRGKLVNILEGLELHTGVFSAAEQKRIVDYVTLLQDMGRKGELKDRTYTAPQKWMRGKGRQTIQFGCCYNYATDSDGNPPDILQNSTVDPIPDLFKVIIRRLVRWHVLPPTCVPDSCIVNIYEEGDCIPPHIDNHDFVRPFCTISFLSECNIVFGSNLKIVGAGEFHGPVAIPLPVGSVLVLNGNGADVAKHCVPAVPTRRISITFRRMDDAKRPTKYVPEPDLQGIQPLVYEDGKEKGSNGPKPNSQMKREKGRRGGSTDGNGIGSAIRSDRFSWASKSTQSPQRSANRRGKAW